MKRTTRRGLAVLILSLVVSAWSAPGAHPTIFDTDDWTELKVNPGKPYNAVGFLNNGCTATLIDPDHILAAQHCFVFGDGTWQRNLRFYPNFHPSRLAAAAPVPPAEDDVPRADVTRAVVATRVGVAEDGNDWGIAKVAKWRDTGGGIDLTPAKLLNKQLKEYDPLIQPGYARHLLPVLPHHKWDPNCGGTPGGPVGAYYIKRGRTPFVDGKIEEQWCNMRWSWGQIRTGCWIRLHTVTLILHNCDSTGGNSGSPLIDPASGSVLGVTGGGGDGPNFSDEKNPPTTGIKYDRTNLGNLTYAAPTARFISAPRYAANVALARRSDGAAATQVFAVDRDLNRVAVRYRLGGTYADPWTYWRNIGAPAKATATRIAACNHSAQQPTPRVFAVFSGALYTRDMGPSPSPWAGFDLPPGVASIGDVDTTNDTAGRCQLFAVAATGSAFTRRMTSDTTWSAWETVATGRYRNITAGKDGTTLRAMMIDTAGHLWSTRNAGRGWSSPAQLPRPSAVGAWIDADLGYDEHGNVRIYAYGGGSRGVLYHQNVATLPGWALLPTRLWGPDPQQPAPVMRTITASRWFEDPAGVTTPTVFGTDDTGNVYFIEFVRSGSTGTWLPEWKSFYTHKIPK